jgi:hypothetical protein
MPPHCLRLLTADNASCHRAVARRSEFLQRACRILRTSTVRLARLRRHARRNRAQLALQTDPIRLGHIDAARRDRRDRVLPPRRGEAEIRSTTARSAATTVDRARRDERHAGVPHLRSCPGTRRQHLRRYPPSPPFTRPAPCRSARHLKRSVLVAPPRVTFPNTGAGERALSPS